MSTPCAPVSPRALHRSKKPSIFAHTPPIACISPSWFTLPVTAIALVDPDVGQRAQDREELARARAVAVDLAVALLERELRAQAERPLLPEHAREVAAQDGDALGVDAPAELRLALDVDDPLAADADDRGDAHRLAELDVAGAEHARAR